MNGDVQKGDAFTWAHLSNLIDQVTQNVLFVTLQRSVTPKSMGNVTTTRDKLRGTQGGNIRAFPIRFFQVLYFARFKQMHHMQKNVKNYPRHLLFIWSPVNQITKDRSLNVGIWFILFQKLVFLVIIST